MQSTRAGAGQRILVLEDDRAIIFLLEAALAHLGFQVIGCKTGEEAVSELERGSYDMVIADLRLPGKMDGLDLLRWIKARAGSPPVIVITAYASSDVMRDLKRLDIQAVVKKPFDIDELVELVEAGLASEASRQSAA